MHLLALLEYDGTAFQGFQTQKNGRTVQAELERALTEFLPQTQRRGARVKTVGGGRTDAGVHAHGQAVSFWIEWTHDLETFQRALNAKLPTDIFVRRVVAVPEKFSARYSAISRVYEYRVWNHPERSVFHTRYATWIPELLDVTAMASAARYLVGKHDFAAFGSAPQGANTVREVKRVEVQRVGDEIIFTFEANAFLYRMVRRMVGTLLLVGRGVMPPDEMMNVLQRQRRAGFSAPPAGLTLREIKYDI
ncbi:MAG: tRNA pseudouridine(38-40) synthase TruA [Chloroflexi bacterium]|nr:tRNA pseudouridine(38-40) synthase TruA [Chloroflexota bacterium]